MVTSVQAKDSPTTRRLMSAADLPELHASKMDSWHDYRVFNPAMQDVRFRAIHACDPGDGMILGLLGDRGVGKTQLAVLMAKTYCRQERAARYTTAADFFLDFRAVYQTDRPSMTERDVLESYIRPPLLVIDELQEWKRTEREQQTLTSLLDHRYRRLGATTVLVANMTIKGLLDNIGPSARRRLEERGGVIRCDWDAISVLTDT